jgi:hypothetical protein
MIVISGDAREKVFEISDCFYRNQKVLHFTICFVLRLLC